MLAKLEGKFLELGTTNMKDGSTREFVTIYTGGEAVKVSLPEKWSVGPLENLTVMDIGDDISLPVSITEGNYGMYIRAVIEI